jgi:hypothetical protein
VNSKIHVLVEDAFGEKRSIYYRAGSTGSFGSNPISISHIGLGKAKKILRLELTWAGSAKMDSFTEVPLNSSYELREGALSLERL